MKTKLIFILMSSLCAVSAFADPGLTLRGRLLKPDGSAVSASAVQFKIQVRTPSPEECLMYEEIQVKDLSQSSGLFSLTLNDGTASSANSEPFTLAEAFRARGVTSFPAAKCLMGSSSNLSATTGRLLSLSFNDGSFAGWENLPKIPAQFSGQALSSATVGGFQADQLFRVVDAGVPQTLGAWTLGSYNTLLDIVNGTGNIGGNASGFTGSLGGDVIGGQSATTVVRLQGREVSSDLPASGDVLTWDHTNQTWRGSPASSGLPPAMTLTGLFLKSWGGVWMGRNIEFSDIKNSMGQSAFAVSSCGENQTIAWSFLTDTMTCQNIGSLPAAVITSGVLDIARIPSSLTDGAWTAGAGNVYRMAGSVGIGTSAPSRLLEVNGTAAVNGVFTARSESIFEAGLRIRQSSPGETQLHFYDSLGTEMWHQKVQGSEFVLRNYQTGVDAFKISSDARLNVANTYFRAPDAVSTRVSLSTAGTGVKSSLLLHRSNGTAAFPSPVMSGDNLGEISWVGQDSTAAKTGAMIFASATENWMGTASGTRLLFGVTPTGATTASPQMALSELGNLGLGTLNPTANLHVVSLEPTIRLQDSDATGTSLYHSKIEFQNKHGAAVGFLGYEGTPNLVLETSVSTHALGLRTNGTERVTVGATGRVGINNTSPSESLDVTGKIKASDDIMTSGNVSGMAFVNTSDMRFKREIHPLDESLARVLNLQGVSYHWRQDEFPERRFNDRRQIGLLAQDVEKEFPELVETDSRGYKSVNYSALVAPVIEAIRELYAKYLSQDSKIASQEKRIQDLEKAISDLRREIACEKRPGSNDCRN